LQQWKTVRIEASPLYLETSALAKIYVHEPDSDALDAALSGRRDLLISDLAVTELTSALARRVREGQVAAAAGRRIYNQLLRDVRAGEYRLLDLTSATHREAERLLLTLSRQTPLRAADSLHLAAAALADARALVTYDRQLHAAALALGTFEVVPAALAPNW
jgi:predicted nucleic acid-binding protein